MARIRTVKPSFLRHERLQDLEAENPNNYIMLVFMGLWMLADSKGKFEYKPRSMKLDILPFLDYSMQATLDILEANYFIKTYVVEGQKYGIIPSFNEHQRLSGKELTDGERFPDEEKQQGSIGEAPGISQDVHYETIFTEENDNSLIISDDERGSDGEAPEKHPDAQEGKGKEYKEGNREGKGDVPSPEKILPIGTSSIYKTMDDVEYICLNQSTIWLEHMTKKLGLKNLENSKKWVVEFFETMRASGQDKRELNDARQHCFNWIKIQLEKEKSSGKKEKEKGKAEAVLEVYDASTEYWDKVKEAHLNNLNQNP